MKVAKQDVGKARLQIPVSRQLADKVAELAKLVNWSQTRMAAKLLDVSLDSKKSVGKWIDAVTCGRIVPLQMGGSFDVRLQVPVSEDLLEKIEAMAECWNQTRLKAAAMLLDFAVSDSEWAYKILGSWFGQLIAPWIGSPNEPYGTAEVPLDEDRVSEAA